MTPVDDPPPATASPAAGPLHRLLRPAAAVLSGLLLYASFPPRTLWWLVLPGFALLGWVLHGRRLRAAFGLGLLSGLGFMLPLLHWTGEDVGPVPWLALAVAEALFIAVGCLGIAAVSRLAYWPVWAAAVWTLDEAVRARIPFGGFPWGKIAFGQSESVFLPLAALGGTPLLSFAVVLCGFGLYEAVRRSVAYRRTGKVPRAAVVGAAVSVLVPVAGALAALPWSTTRRRTARPPSPRSRATSRAWASTSTPSAAPSSTTTPGAPRNWPRM